MTDDTLSPQDEQLFDFFKRGAANLWLVECVEAGFTEDQARTVLESDALLEALADIGDSMEPGPGFLRAALDQSERGQLNRRLLRQVTRSQRSPGGPYALARYELAAWLKQYHPGTGDPANPLDEQLLDLELGTLAWHNAPQLGGSSIAAQALEGTGPAILRLARRIGPWTGWRRELADDVLATACEALVATHPEAAEAPAIRQLLGRIEAGEPFAEIVDAAPGQAHDVPVSQRREFALAAGSEDADVVVLGGPVLIDSDLVAPRSVAPGWEGLWEIIEGETVVLRIQVPVGDAPVSALTAHLTVDGQEHTVELPERDATYTGQLVLPDTPALVHVEATAQGSEPSDTPDDELIELNGLILQSTLDRRSRVGAYDDGSVNPLTRIDRPFLCEIIAWGSSL